MGWRGWTAFAAVQLVGAVCVGVICPLAPRTGSYDTRIA